MKKNIAKNILINKNCRKIIALGGGSVIDVAKAILIFYNIPNQDIWLYFNKLKKLGKYKVFDRLNCNTNNFCYW